MTDKDLLVVISEMLRKQDQQAELLSKQAVVLNHHTQILTDHTRLIKDNNDTLKEFVDVSVKEFEWQHKQAEIQQQFNERFLAKLDEISNKL